RKRLKEGRDPFTNLIFTHDCSNFNKGVVNSSYKYLPSMKEKVEKQMEFVDKLRSLNPSDVAKLVIDRHFIRDIRGNLRKFSQQEFRCSKCNEKYRRPPLVGKCWNCGGNIIFTISEGSIVKYLEPALQLAEKYKIPEYMKQSLELTKSYIESIFGKESEKQADLKKWF
ncbi:MAG: DNA polymerase II large subunit, partial [Candidatus Pacearchaeota archaeon]